ncbi:MAG: hypothetical protein KJ062_19895, partial [Thermoanaerobaculia bacterium]|nr:hypothetical protein [Thermoanaerobaculia bacterium]
PACNDCRRVARREHPDLLVAAPERSRRANTPPFDEASDSKETTIPTALVRALASDAFRLPYEGSRRVLVLLDVDRTEAAAFSALLKVLEEPPSRARFVLTATRPRLLPPTILSRLVLRRLPSPSREELVAALVSRGMTSEEAAARAAFRAAGEEEALELDLGEARETRDALLEAASGTLLSGSTGWALVLAGGLAAEDAAATAERFALLARILRDAVAAGTDPAGKTVLHAERYRDLALLAAAGTGVLLEAATGALREAADLPDSRRNPRLAAESYALSLLKL